ncbi:hypothetical protein M0Q50_10720 [bacterium]|jgi:hypothetical protein|nr:hypothetical protein [bacterium]
MKLSYDNRTDVKPEFNFDLRTDIGETFILMPIDVRFYHINIGMMMIMLIDIIIQKVDGLVKISHLC